jgi:hypothetical protein
MRPVQSSSSVTRIGVQMTDYEYGLEWHYKDHPSVPASSAYDTYEAAYEDSLRYLDEATIVRRVKASAWERCDE